MSDDPPPIAAARLSGLALVVALGAFYVVIGHEWYFKGSMVLCTSDEVMKRTSWCYRNPQADTLDPADPLGPSLGSINENYRGVHEFWGDDIISNLFRQIGNALTKWFIEFSNVWFWPVFAPQWNAFFSSDDTSASGHRIAFGVIVGVFYGALVSRIIGSLVDWAHGK